jgi:triphosphoribosyl-dephospho-CoA synthase
MRSARAAAEAFARPELRVGALILAAVRATHREVGCNTNLGIVLLCAPLARGARVWLPRGDLARGLGQVLAELNRDDAHHVYSAIRLAKPAGLGRSPRYDVSEPAQVGLLEAMRAAADRDRIAYQYANDFADVFELGLPRLRQELRLGRGWRWATVGVYLEFLARIPDSHIRRKSGDVLARRVLEESQAIGERFRRLTDPRGLTDLLAPFDRELKDRGLNPGTSADLTVATLFAHRLASEAMH